MTDFISTDASNIEVIEEQRLLKTDDETLKNLPELPEGVLDGSSWTCMDETDVIDMFSELNAFKEGTGKVEWDKLDYDIYGEDWYRLKYPHFPDEWYDLMVKASREKYKNLQKQDENGMTIEKGNFTVSFN